MSLNDFTRFIRKYQSYILLSVFYLTLSGLSIWILPNLTVYILLLTYLVFSLLLFAYIYKNYFNYMVVSALIFMTFELLIKYSITHLLWLKTTVGIFTGIIVYSVLVYCLIDIIKIFIKKTQYMKLIAIIRIIVLIFLYDAVLRTIGNVSGVLTFEENFIRFTIEIYLLDYLYLIIKKRWRNRYPNIIKKLY